MFRPAQRLASDNESTGGGGVILETTDAHHQGYEKGHDKGHHRGLVRYFSIRYFCRRIITAKIITYKNPLQNMCLAQLILCQNYKHSLYYYQSNSFACSLANRDKPVAATLHRKRSGVIIFVVIAKLITQVIVPRTLKTVTSLNKESRLLHFPFS